MDMIQRDADMLTAAIERNSAAVLSLPSAGMVRYHKTRFLRGEGERIWIESVPAEHQLIQTLIEQKQPVLIAFKGAGKTVSFSSAIYELDGSYKFFDALEPVQAVMLHRPELVKPQQRRTHFRAPVRDDDNYTVELWRIAEHVYLNDQPNDLCKLPAKVVNLSAGGVGVAFTQRPILTTDQRLRVLLKCGELPVMLLEGRSCELRHDQAAQTYEVGIQFRELQATVKGRQTITELTRIVNGLQLKDARRQRGLSA